MVTLPYSQYRPLEFTGKERDAETGWIISRNAIYPAHERNGTRETEKRDSLNAVIFLFAPLGRGGFIRWEKRDSLNAAIFLFAPLGRGALPASSPVSLSPVTSAMYGDGVFGLVEQHAVVADAHFPGPLQSPLGPRTWSMVKPRSATTRSKGMPPSGFCRKYSREAATA